jgi:uncharacterized membrane protein HdeD (DUF308 family)
MGAKVQTRGMGVAIAAGAVSVVAGILVIVWPDISLLTLALITGFNIMVISGVALGHAIAGAEVPDRTLRIVVGVFGIIAGIVIIRRPGETILVIVLAAGIWLVMSGLVDMVRAVVIAEGRGLRFLGGGLDFVLGILVLSLPDVTLKLAAVLIGISFIARGILIVLAARELKHMNESAAASPA